MNNKCYVTKSGSRYACVIKGKHIFGCTGSSRNLSDITDYAKHLEKFGYEIKVEKSKFDKNELSNIEKLLKGRNFIKAIPDSELFYHKSAVL